MSCWFVFVALFDFSIGFGRPPSCERETSAATNPAKDCHLRSIIEFHVDGLQPCVFERACVHSARGVLRICPWYTGGVAGVCFDAFLASYIACRYSSLSCRGVFGRAKLSPIASDRGIPKHCIFGIFDAWVSRPRYMLYVMDVVCDSC
jgi:hypothetical protein